MKNYYFNPKTQDLMIFDTERNEIDVLEVLKGIDARNQDRVMALKEIREAHSAVFDKLFDAGVFECKLGTLDMAIRNTPLPEDRKQAIRATFENWGLLAAPKEIITKRERRSEKTSSAFR